MSVRTGGFLYAPFVKGEANGVSRGIFVSAVPVAPVIPGLTRDPGSCGSRHRERSAAISSFFCRHTDCHVTSFLAMTFPVIPHLMRDPCSYGFCCFCHPELVSVSLFPRMDSCLRRNNILLLFLLFLSSLAWPGIQVPVVPVIASGA